MLDGADVIDQESDRTPDERTRVYILVDAIAETLAAIQAGGGRIITPRAEIGPVMGVRSLY